jgi:hypothetical protein
MNVAGHRERRQWQNADAVDRGMPKTFDEMVIIGDIWTRVGGDWKSACLSWSVFVGGA